jgi:adhesin HecA-like repeat protein
MTSNNVRFIISRKAQCFALALMLCFLAPLWFSASAQADSVPVVIDLSDDGIAVDSPGIYADGSKLTITLPGEYLLRGTLSNGQIIVDCEQEGKVRLYLGGISVHCENGPALYIKKCAPRLTIDLVEGTVNMLSDGANYADQQGKENGAIYSKSDLTITGMGTLDVTGAYKHGIVSKDDLRIKGGTINVSAVKNGIVGKDCVEIFDGVITVRAGNDGIKTTNEDAEWGYILMEGGTVSITCGDDPHVFVHGISLMGGTVKAVIDSSLKPSDD